MRPYEIVCIINPTLDEQSTNAVVTRVTDAIRSCGGQPGRIEKWGRRKLAYQIKKHAEGYYVLFECTGEPSKINALDRMLHLSDEILRHKIIRVPPQAAGRSLAAPPALEDVAAAGSERDPDQ